MLPECKIMLNIPFVLNVPFVSFNYTVRMHLKWISEKSFTLMYRRPNFFQSMALLHLKSHWLERPTLKALIYLGSNFLETNLLQSFDLLFQQPIFSVALPLLDCKDHWRYLRKALIWCSSGQFSPSPLTEKQLILEAGFGGLHLPKFKFTWSKTLEKFYLFSWCPSLEWILTAKTDDFKGPRCNL